MALTALNLLSARKVETAQPRPKVYQLRDGGSLFLRVQPNGSKLWWYRYRLGGAEQVYSIGVYPKVTLEAARAERDRAKALVKKGLDPIVEKKAAIALQADTYERTFGSGSSAMLTGASTTPTRSPATLRRMFSPGLASCRSAASGLHICAPSSRMWRLVARRLWRSSSASGVGKSSVMRLPKVSANTILPPCSRDWSSALRSATTLR